MIFDMIKRFMNRGEDDTAAEDDSQESTSTPSANEQGVQSNPPFSVPNPNASQGFPQGNPVTRPSTNSHPRNRPVQRQAGVQRPPGGPQQPVPNYASPAQRSNGVYPNSPQMGMPGAGHHPRPPYQAGPMQTRPGSQPTRIAGPGPVVPPQHPQRRQLVDVWGNPVPMRRRQPIHAMNMPSNQPLLGAPQQRQANGGGAPRQRPGYPPQGPQF